MKGSLLAPRVGSASAGRHFRLLMGLEVAEKTELVLGLLLGTGGHLQAESKGKKGDNI